MEFSIDDLKTAKHFLSLSEPGGHNREYWAKRVISRLNFINPLIHELTIKGINLIELSKELNTEYNELNSLRIKHKL